LSGVDEQASTKLPGISGMAFIAIFDEDGPNFRFIEIEPRTFESRIASPD
jgi:hypothetical protein